MRGSALEFDLTKLKNEDFNGIYAEISSLLGLEATLKIYNKFRGTQVSFPVEILSREFIFKKIRAEYTGYNIRELATKYGYTEKWIRKIALEDNQEEAQEQAQAETQKANELN